MVAFNLTEEMPPHQSWMEEHNSCNRPKIIWLLNLPSCCYCSCCCFGKSAKVGIRPKFDLIAIVSKTPFKKTKNKKNLQITGMPMCIEPPFKIYDNHSKEHTH